MELLASTDAAELTEAMAYYRIEPWGEWREDYRAALICYTLYRLLSAKTAAPLSVDDWMPEFDREAKTPSDIMAVLAGMTAAAGGTIEKAR